MPTYLRPCFLVFFGFLLFRTALAQGFSIYINGQQFHTKILLIHGVLYVTAQPLTNTIGASLARKGKHLRIGNTTIKESFSDKNGVLYLPIRKLVAAAGYDFRYNATTRMVDILFPANNSVMESTSPSQGAGYFSFCDSENIMGQVYHPYRLEVRNPCTMVSGVVDSVRLEPDGDAHINLNLDPSYQRLINERNISGEHGDLVVEVTCVHSVTQADAISTCEGVNKDFFQRPTIGSHVYVVGAYVLDRDHGWMEIHPAWYIGTNYPGGQANPWQPPTGGTIINNASQGSQDENEECKGLTLCVDGTCSYSTGRGTCSHHGGVSRW